MTSRDISQQKFVDLWIKNNYIGGLAALPAYGKSRTAIKCAIQSKSIKTTIIVPTIVLKNQWLNVLKEWKVSNYEVIVVNTAANMKLDTDLLILDEAHNTASADWFKQSWTNATFKKFLWLSGTIERKDNKHKELIKIAPSLMSVDFKEALTNNWVSNYTIYNYGLSFTKGELLISNKIEQNLENIYENVAFVEQTTFNSIKKNMFTLSRTYIKNKDKNKELFIYALNYMKLIAKRKKLLYEAKNKKIKTLWLLQESKLKGKQTILFSQTQDFADFIYENNKEHTVVIHSKMKTKDRNLSLKTFLDKRTKKNVISSVKALNQGIDIPRLEVGIRSSFTSSKIDNLQILGRLCRLNENNDKHAVMINLYIKNSNELYWLNNSQVDIPKEKIRWIT